MDDIQNLQETQACLELIHEAYSIICKRKGLEPAPLYFEFMVGNQYVRQWNQNFIDALNKYMLVNGFSEGIKSLWDVQTIHQKIINQN
jgi:hypothetical protein